MSKNKQYKRLPGRGSGVGIIRPSRQSLWQGENHILFVNNRGYTENYKKFYFSDIQSIILHKTFRGQLWNILLGLGTFTALCFVLTGSLYHWTTPTMTVICLIATSFASFLAINLLLGPSCACYIQTAVQTERLYAIYRLRTGRKLLKLLKPIIEAVQGIAMEATMRELYATNQQNPRDTRNNQEAKQRLQHMPKIRKHSNANAPLVLFSLLLISSLLATACLISYSMLWLILGIIAFAMVNIMTLLSIVKQHKTDIPKAIASLVFVSLGYIFIMYLTGVMESIAFKFTHMHSNTDIATYTAFFKLSPWESRFRMFSVVLSLILSGSISIPGIALVVWFRKTSRVPPPPPAMGTPIAAPAPTPSSSIIDTP